MDNKTVRRIQDKHCVGAVVILWNEDGWRIFGQCIQNDPEKGWRVGERYCLSGEKRRQAKLKFAICHKTLHDAIEATLKD